MTALSKSKSVVDMLDMTAADKKKLINWANSRGSSNSKSAKKTFKGRVQLIRIGGHLHFEVPVTAQAQSYKVLGQVGRQVAHIPAYGTRASLNQRVMLHGNGATGGLKMMAGSTIGVALAVGPQAYFDYTSSTTLNEFANKSIYSQPANLASFGAGALVSVVLASSLVGAPLVIVLLVGWGVGVGVQAYMSGSGADKEVGDYLMKLKNAF